MKGWKKVSKLSLGLYIHDTVYIHFWTRESLECAISYCLALFKRFHCFAFSCIEGGLEAICWTYFKRREHVIPCVIKLCLTLKMQQRESLEVSGRDQRKETNNNKKTAINRKQQKQQGGENETLLW